MSRTALIFDPDCKNHDTGRGHPEQPARIDAVWKGLEAAGLTEQVLQIKPKACEAKWMETCHGKDYLAQARDDVAAGRALLTTGDTNIGKESWRIAGLAAGAVLTAVDAVMGEHDRGDENGNGVDNAFCAMRPPGHHACPRKGMGFCLLSNIAIGARYAQQNYGIGKVMIVDWDVHHGNGTQDVFYEDDSVFFFSTHQSPWYPGTGAADETGKGKGLGTTLNVPLAAGAGQKEVMGAFSNALLKAANRFKPELVMISAGFDSREGDPLGGFRLQDEDFADLTSLMKDIAGEFAGGRVVSVLEGGYHLDGLGRASAAHVQALLA